MTWIVGMPTMFGYSMGISDIRVTFSDGSELDCLQKIYPISSSIALGFAGSVHIGFQMVAAMRLWLRCDEPSRAWKPLETVELWPQVARAIFADCPESERALQCSLMMLSADPDATNGLAPKTYVHTFASPGFEAVEIAPHKASAIGSGNYIEEFRRHLDNLSNNHESNFGLMKGETGNPGGMGTMLGFSLTRMLKRTAPAGISSHLHYCWVYLGKTIIKTNDHSTVGAWTGFESGSGINRPAEPTKRPTLVEPEAAHFTMPEIAQSWAELETLVSKAGAVAEGSVT